jgi:hypothetical protein
MDNKTVEIWICGRKLCETTTQNHEVIEDFERIVRKAGYSILEREEDGKIIKIV